MNRYLITLAYKGTNYHGWQMQKNAHTVQAELMSALQTVLRQKVCMFGAGRTDTGVHASFFVAHFDVEDKITLDYHRLLRSLNGVLPDDIVVYDLFGVDKTFHSRFDALSRRYRYFINLNKNPFFVDYGFYYRYDNLSFDLMQEAATIIMEYDDFKSFQREHSDAKTTICKIYESYWEQKDNQLMYTVRANRFLRNMVRSMVGTMIDVGRGKISLNDFRTIIESRDRKKASASAVANGLFLVDIEYAQPLNAQLDVSRKKAKYVFEF